MGLRATPGLAALALGVALGAAPTAATGPDPSQVAARAATADPAELADLASQLAPPPSAEAPWWVAAADALGALVGRARALEDASIEVFRALVVSGDALAAAVESARTRLEEAAAGDEQTLEALYRSADWQRLGYAAASIGYWRGWAELGLGHRLPAGGERDAALAAARAAFARSARALSVPELARGSLLGLGLTDLERGEPEAAREALERLLAALEPGDPSGLRTPALQALAVAYARKGELQRAAEVAARIPRDTLGERDRLELLALDAEVALEALRRGEGDPDRAAGLVRELATSGGDAALRASELAVRYREELAGRDLGPLGDLLAADDAFRNGRWESARAAYARALAAPGSIAGLDVARARYRYGVALERSGAAEEAAAELERALGEAADPALEREIATEWYAVCEARVGADPGPHSVARAARAARALLRLAPDAPQAATARIRLARALESGRDGGAALRELERVEPGSPAYAPARLEAARLRADALQRRENAGERPDTAEARRLLADLDAAGALELDPSRQAALAVLRAKASAWAGESPETVAARVAEARALPGLDADGRRSLRRVELRTWVRSGDYVAVDRLLDGVSDDEIRRDGDLFAELLAELPSTPQADPTWERGYQRVAPLAPTAAREALDLDRARRLLGSGRASQAAEVAERLVEADPSWAQARILLARSLEAEGRPEAALEAWDRVAAGLEAASPGWTEAQLALARIAARRGDRAAACEAVRVLGTAGAKLSPEDRAALERLRCPP